MTDAKTDIFNQHRSRLFGLAYRMLGSFADAEDVVQDAYLKWHRQNEAEIASAEAWLVTVATRLSIDRLRKASARRETYIGPWLPEPILTADSPEETAERAADLSIAFLTLLEKLSPVERAAFLLHDVFDCDYRDIAAMIEKTEPAARQIVSRARGRLRQPATRFTPDNKEKLRLLRQFREASRAGDHDALMSVFSRDAVLYSDGGGKVTAARKPVRGRERLVRLFEVAGPKFVEDMREVFGTVNGEPALMWFSGDSLFAVTTATTENGAITALYRVLNPEKLARLDSFLGKRIVV